MTVLYCTLTFLLGLGVGIFMAAVHCKGVTGLWLWDLRKRIW